MASEHCAIVLDGERSQTDNVLVISQGLRQVADEEMHRTDMRPVRKAVCRRLNSVGHLGAAVCVEHRITSLLPMPVGVTHYRADVQRRSASARIRVTCVVRSRLPRAVLSFAANTSPKERPGESSESTGASSDSLVIADITHCVAALYTLAR